MSEQRTESRPRRAGKWKLTGAAVLSAMAASPAAQAAHREGYLAGFAHPGSGDLIANQPGVSPENQQALKDSTAAILFRDMTVSPNTPTWTELCTGTKIQFGGQFYIMTAAHCLVGITKSVGKTQSESGNISSRYGYNATNYLTDHNLQYAIGDPLQELPIRVSWDTQQLGYVTGVSVHTRPHNGVDAALLQIGPTNPSTSPDKLINTAPRIFDAVPALNYDVNFKIGHPRAGESVTAYAFTNNSDFKSVTSQGKYLGRIWYPHDPTRQQLDVVGINANTPEQAACDFSGSGSAAIGRDGYVFGPLSAAQKWGYGSSNRNEFAPLPGTGKYNVFCYFSVVDKQALQQMANGFNNFPTSR